MTDLFRVDEQSTYGFRAWSVWIRRASDRHWSMVCWFDECMGDTIEDAYQYAEKRGFTYDRI